MEELLLVKGVTPELYRKVEPYLTVYGSGQLNLNTASPVALRALGLSKAGVDGLISYRSGEDDVERTPDDRRLSSIDSVETELEKYVPAEDRTRLIALTKSLAVGSSAFRTTIRASSGEPARSVSANCVIDRRGLVKLWEER